MQFLLGPFPPATLYRTNSSASWLPTRPSKLHLIMRSHESAQITRPLNEATSRVISAITRWIHCYVNKNLTQKAFDTPKIRVFQSRVYLAILTVVVGSVIVAV